MYRINKDNEIRILLIGKTGAGKSETGNTILGNDDKFDTSPNPRSVTQFSQLKINSRFSRKLVVVDTPGVYNHNESTDKITNDVKESMVLISPGPHAILVCVPMTRFDKTDMNTLEFYSRMFGDDLKSYAVIAFTHCDEWQRKLKLKDPNDLENEKQEFLNQLLDEYKIFISNNRYVLLNNIGDSYECTEQARMLIKKITKIHKLNGRNYYTNEKFQEIEKRLQRGERFESIKKAAFWGTFGTLAVLGGFGVIGVASQLAVAGVACSQLAAKAGALEAAQSMAMSAGSFIISAGTMAVANLFRR